MARVTRFRLISVLAISLVGLAGTGAGGFLDSPASATPVSLYASGLNNDGQLGAGEISGPQTCSSTPCSTFPVSVELPAGVSAGPIVAGGAVAYTVGSDGNLYGWGDNTYGELGNGTSTGPDLCNPDEYCSPTPVQVELPTVADPPQKVVTSGTSTLAIGANNVLYGWGDDVFGTLGTGTNAAPATCQSNIPCAVVPTVIALPGGAQAEDVAVGTRTAFAVASNGVLYSWGFGEYGELGNGTYSSGVPSAPGPVDLPGGVAPTHVFAGDYSVFADTSTGVVYSWGYNYYGQLGHGENLANDGVDGGDNADSFIDIPWTVAMPSGVHISSLQSTGFYTTFAIGSDSNLYVWGNNNADFGTGSTVVASSSPLTVTLPNGVSPSALAAYDSSGSVVPSVYVVGSDQNLYVWGASAYGEFGNGDSAAQTIELPTQVSDVSDVSDVAAGSSFSIIEGSVVPQFSLTGNNVADSEDLNDCSTFALITPASPSSPTGYTATINWGDGSATSAGTVEPDGQDYVVQGCHAYSSTGMFTATTTVGGVGPSQFTTSQVTVSVPPAPTVSSSAPDALGQLATATLDLSGTNFTLNSSDVVSFSNTGVTVDSVTYVSSAELDIQVSVAKHAPLGLANIMVITPGGSGKCTACLTIDRAPKVTSITGSLKAGFTKTVTVLGKRFQSGLSVTTNIGGATVGSPTNLTSTSFRVSVTVPGATTPGNYQLIVTNPDEGTETYSQLKVH